MTKVIIIWFDLQPSGAFGLVQIARTVSWRRPSASWDSACCRALLLRSAAIQSTSSDAAFKPQVNRRSSHVFITLKGKRSPYSIAERRVPELIPVLGSQPAGGVSHKPGGRLPLLSARPAVTPAILKRVATSFAAWWTEAQWVWTVCLRLLPDSVAAAIWTRALLRLSPAR